MTATTPDSHPDSLPAGPSEDVEQVSPDNDASRESVEDTPESTGSGASYGTHDGSPLDPPGIEDGVSGSAGYNKSQDDVTS